MRIHFDEKEDAIYIRFDQLKIIESQEVQSGIILDFNEKNQVVGIEILGVNKRIPKSELKKMHFEIA